MFEVTQMDTAKLFANGKSQAVRLPKDFRFQGDEVFIKRIGDAVLLIPKEQAWQTFLNGLESFTPDFFAQGRGEERAAQRDRL